MPETRGRPPSCKTATAVADFLGIEVAEQTTANLVAKLIEERFKKLERDNQLLKKANALLCKQRDDALTELASRARSTEN